MRMRLKLWVVLASEEKRVHGSVKLNNLHALRAIIRAGEDEACLRESWDGLRVDLVSVTMALPHDCGVKGVGRRSRG
jgi:hypothetical protein